MPSEKTQKIIAVLRRAKRVAKDYYKLTKRPLGLTGEVAEYEAIRLLRLRPAEVRQAGYDAVRKRNGKLERIQIKGRCVADDTRSRGRMGRIDLTKSWDCVYLVLLDRDFDATEIFRAERRAVVKALRKPGSRARNERGMLAISKFKQISISVWPRR